MKYWIKEITFHVFEYSTDLESLDFETPTSIKKFVRLCVRINYQSRKNKDSKFSIDAFQKMALPYISVQIFLLRVIFVTSEKKLQDAVTTFFVVKILALLVLSQGYPINHLERNVMFSFTEKRIVYIIFTSVEGVVKITNRKISPKIV